MNADPQQAKAIFLEAVEKHAPDQWPAFLDQACPGQTELRRRVEVLLEAHREAGTAAQQAGDESPPPVIGGAAEKPGAVIGPYKLIEPIGEGGMGTVWMAQQTEPVKRLVAVKLIKAGMDSKQVIARFEAERQALALMDHPNIAKVLDADTTSIGRPYFVMDLVKGVPITKYCDEHHLTPRQRLELFVPVCQAVQHAHQKGIIHRDLKPSNVLVALYDGKPVPKVIDFGVAKAAGQSLTDKTLVTGFGAIVGTLEYMSPEQAEINQLDIDTRSDIYSLGVLLYELLAGSPPFTRKELEKAGMLEMLRLIREQEPTKPSTKLSTAEGLPTLAANRATEPAKLTRLVRGELDWIVMKALEKDRNRRYQTANGLAMDVRRYLADEPVQACPPSVGYRLRKFIRRNRASVLVALTILLVLVAGIIGTSWGLVRATGEAEEKERARQAAEENFRRSRKVVDDFFTVVSQSTLFDVPGLQPLRKELLEKAQRYYQEMAEKRHDDPEIIAGLAVAHLRLAQVLYEVGRYDDALAALDAGLHVAELLRAQHPFAKDNHRKLAGYWKGERRMQSGPFPKDPTAARRTLTAWAKLWERFAREIPDEPLLRSDLAIAYHRLGAFEGALQRWDQSIEYTQKAIALLEGLRQNYPKEARHREGLVLCYGDLLYYMNNAGRPFVPEWRERRIALCYGLAADFPTVPLYQEWLGEALIGDATQLAAANHHQEAQARLEHAVQLIKRLVEQFPKEPDFRLKLVDGYSALAASTNALNKPLEAEALFRKALQVAEHLDTDFPLAGADPGHHARQLGFLLIGLDRAAEAEKLIAYAVEAYEKAEKLTGMTHRRSAGAFARRELGDVMLLQKRPKEAEDQFRKSVEINFTLPVEFLRAGAARWHVNSCVDRLIEFLREAKRPQDTARVLEQAIDFYARLGTELPREAAFAQELAERYQQLAWLLTTSADPTQHDAKRAVELASKALELGPDQGMYWTTSGVAHYRLGDWKQAAAALQKSMELRKGGDSFDWFFLAMAHWKLGEKDKAREWYDRAVQWMDRNQPKNEELSRFRAEAEELLELKEKKEDG